MKLKVGRAAADDMEGIWLYTTEHWSMGQADRYLGLLMDGFEQIRIDPTCGREFAHVRPGYKALNIGAHVIFYRLADADQVVEVVRVLHERMDQENRVKP